MNGVTMTSGLAMVCGVFVAGWIPPVAAGTEEEPELADPPNNVQYDPTYPFQRDHDYLDILAAWWQYDEPLDRLRLTVKVLDSGPLAQPPPDWTISCGSLWDISADNHTVGMVGIGWTQPGNGSPAVTYASWYPPQESGVQGRQPNRIPHMFELAASSPGYFTFYLDRARLLLFGDTAERPMVNCYETYDPTDTLDFLWNNVNAAESEGAYSFRDLRRLHEPDGTLDPAGTPDARGEATNGRTESPGPGIVLGLIVLGLVCGACLRLRWG